VLDQQRLVGVQHAVAGARHLASLGHGLGRGGGDRHVRE
jgi:hypothetical protein